MLFSLIPWSILFRKPKGPELRTPCYLICKFNFYLKGQRFAIRDLTLPLRKKSDVYLKREIELLELERQRLALKLSIKDYKDKEREGEDEG